MATFEIINGNCFEKLGWVVNKVKNPIIVTDPPFNIGYHYGKYDDKMEESEYFNKISSIVKLCPCVMVHYAESLYRIAMESGICPKKVVSWVYNANTAKQHRDVCFFGVEPNFNQIRQSYKNANDKRIKERIENGLDGCKLYDWWFVNQVKNVSSEKTNHPCQMPFEVMRYIVGILPNDVKWTIIDPFCGSGTTGEACKEFGYDFVGIEIDHNYVEIAKNRLNDIYTFCSI